MSGHRAGGDGSGIRHLALARVDDQDLHVLRLACRSRGVGMQALFPVDLISVCRKAKRDRLHA